MRLSIKGTGQFQKFGQSKDLLSLPDMGRKILTLSKEKFKYSKEQIISERR